jgi:hypothetical protein
MSNENNTELISKLISETTTLNIAKAFLKSNNLPYSASSWEDLINKRIKPAIIDGQLTNEALTQFLREAEEFGNQHVFLYKCDKNLAASIIDPVRAETKLKELNLWGLVTDPLTLSQPNDPTLSEIRWDDGRYGNSIVFKLSQTRVSEKLESESKDGNRVTRSYEYVRERAISLAKLHSNGCLEIRINAQSGNYEADIGRIFNLIPMLNKTDFEPESLTKAKEKIWKDKASLTATLRLGRTVLENEHGNTIILATGSKTNDLAKDMGAVGSTDVFINAKGSWDGLNVWFNQVGGGASEDIHVIINGLINEFSVPANCKKNDYEYVLDQLKTFNK